MTDEERSAILERLRTEQDLRKELAKPESEAASGSSWWQSKLGLLVIGSAISSLLLPWLQYTQKTFEWKRQNQFENTKYRLERMRECLTEFTVLWAFHGEAYERSRAVLLKPSITENDRQTFRDQFVDLQNRRFRQNAKVVSLTIHFHDSAALRQRFQEFLTLSHQYVRALETAVRAAGSGGPDAAAQLNDTDTLLQSLDSLYSAIVANMKEQIGRAEDESEHFQR